MPLKGQTPKQVVHTEMHKFKEGELHSGSKKGPVVKNRKQAIAIALSESGQSKKKGYDRSSHHKGNPGFPSSETAGGSPPKATYAKHESREKEVMGAGYGAHERASQRPGLSEIVTTTARNRTPHAFNVRGQRHDGVLRNSGHSRAHRIGKK